MKRKKPLRADPEKVREFIQRGRAQGLGRSEGLSRGKGLQRGRDSSDRPKPAKKSRPKEGPLTPAEWRAEVWRLDEGTCCGCGRSVPRDADRWTWQAHHPIEKQKLRRRGLYHLVWDPRNGIVLCRRCHERQTTATERVPGEQLPGRCGAFARDLGEWAVDVLDAEHPSGRSGMTAAGRTPTTPGGSSGQRR